MVLSYYVVKYPYRFVWNILNFFCKRREVVFYCANELDIEIFKNVQRHLNPVPVVTKNRKTQRILKERGIKASLLPVFPKGVIMCRQACYLFPGSKIIRIGINHGAYHFKPFANVKGHNMFNQFHFSSSFEVEEAKQIGITSGVGLGFPKMDDAFNGTYSPEYLNQLKAELQIDQTKKTVLFSATWDESKMSAVHLWYQHIEQFTDNYNVLVTLHVRTSDKYKKALKNTPNVHYIESQTITPYIMIADICVGDTSSILSEMCALQKPIVTFWVPKVKMTVPTVREMIKQFSFQIKDVDELPEMLEYAYKNSHQKQAQRDRANKIMFEKFDGKAGERIAARILEELPELKKGNPPLRNLCHTRMKINPKYEQYRSFLEQIPFIFDTEGETIYEGRNNIKIFQHKGISFNVKSFKIPHLINKVAYAWLRGSKAYHSFKYGMEILKRNANTPEPIAYIELLKNGVFHRSFYISLQYDADFTIRELIGLPFDDKENILRQFTRFTYEKMHKKGIHHLDYSRGNVLIKRLPNHQYDFSVVDINRLRFEAMPFEKGLRNFAHIWAYDEEIEIVAREYARITNHNEQETVDLLYRYIKEHKAKINKRMAMKAKLRGEEFEELP